MKTFEDLTDSEKLSVLNKRLKRIEISNNIQTGLVVIAFFGIVSLAVLSRKIKKAIK